MVKVTTFRTYLPSVRPGCPVLYDTGLYDSGVVVVDGVVGRRKTKRFA